MSSDYSQYHVGTTYVCPSCGAWKDGSTRPVETRLRPCDDCARHANDLWARYDMAHHGMPERPYPELGAGSTSPAYHCANCGAVMADPDASRAVWCLDCYAVYLASVDGASSPEVDPSEMCAEFSIEELRAQLASSPGAAELRTCDCGVTNLHLAGAMVAPVNPCACPGELVRAAEVAPSTEWIETRRGLVGLCEVRTARPGELAPFVTWVWFTEAGDTGEVDGSAGRAMAITDAYVSLVRASSPAPSFPWALS